MSRSRFEYDSGNDYGQSDGFGYHEAPSRGYFSLEIDIANQIEMLKEIICDTGNSRRTRNKAYERARDLNDCVSICSEHGGSLHDHLENTTDSDNSSVSSVSSVSSCESLTTFERQCMYDKFKKDYTEEWILRLIDNKNREQKFIQTQEKTHVKKKAKKDAKKAKKFQKKILESAGLLFSSDDEAE